MSTPFSLIWTDESDNTLTSTSFPVIFPGVASIPSQLQVRSNAAELQTFETLVNVNFFLMGDANDVDIVQNVWPALGGVTHPELNGGIDISFDFGRTYTRFDSTHGVKGTPATWILLPAEAVGTQGIDGTLAAFDTAHLIVRYVVPPGATQYQKLNVNLGIDFDII